VCVLLSPSTACTADPVPAPAVIVLPIRVILAHTVLRWRSRSVRVLGRPALADFVVKLAQFILSRLHVAQSRIIFNRDRSYNLVHGGPYFKGARDWVTRVEVNGTAGRWIALPGTRRAEDQVVLYFIHGGGFVCVPLVRFAEPLSKRTWLTSLPLSRRLDTGSNAQDILLHAMKALNLKKSVQASVFCLDYRAFELSFSPPRALPDLTSPLLSPKQASRPSTSTRRSSSRRSPATTTSSTRSASARTRSSSPATRPAATWRPPSSCTSLVRPRRSTCPKSLDLLLVVPA